MQHPNRGRGVISNDQIRGFKLIITYNKFYFFIRISGEHTKVLKYNDCHILIDDSRFYSPYYNTKSLIINYFNWRKIYKVPKMIR